MRTKRFKYFEGDGGYDLSISDLMSGLCGIFILIMIAVILQLNTTKSEYMAKNKKAEDYYSMQLMQPKSLQKKLFYILFLLSLM